MLCDAAQPNLSCREMVSLLIWDISMNPSVPHSYQIQILNLFLFGKVSRLSGPLQSSAWVILAA